jgi:anti-anti-sigma regulatory factor
MPEHVARVIELRGVVDVPAAARLRDAVLALDAHDRVVIDCHEVRDLHDTALALLVSSLSCRGRTITLRGLGEHHLRLLRYLGVDPAASVAR